jgi:hypothetical protein
VNPAKAAPLYVVEDEVLIGPVCVTVNNVLEYRLSSCRVVVVQRRASTPARNGRHC